MNKRIGGTAAIESSMDYLLLFSLLLLTYSSLSSALRAEDATIAIDGTRAVANTDVNYICATIDWWPPEKCNYNQCPWGSSSILNLDLSHPLLGNAIRAFKSLRIRIGGSLEDQVLYNVGDVQTPCHGFTRTRDGLFGFSSGCLPMDRWDEAYHLFNDTGVLVTFGLNALHGRRNMKQGPWGGDWDSSNTKDFIEYTISKGQKIDSWEFGNELSGKGVGVRVEAEQYGKDLIMLKNIIDNLYRNFNPKPILVAPGGFYDKQWFDQLLEVSGSLVVNAVSHHIYNLGPGNDPNLVSKILDPNYLSKISDTFSNLKQTIQSHGPWSSAWVGESGGAYNSGGRNVSNTFINSFWYLDQLGMAAMYDTKVYCRQTLIGGNYGLLDTTTFVPNPDYYSALLWHRLMGKEVLALDSSASPDLRTYAHCSKGREGITLLLINLSNQTQFYVSIEKSIKKISVVSKGTSFLHVLKRSLSWVGIKSSSETFYREEYHFTPEDGYIKSRTMLLNGKALRLTNGEDIPVLEPVLLNLYSPLLVPPLSIKFVVFPNFDAPVCR